MTRRTAGSTAILGLVLTAPAWAAPPQINGTTPFGAQKGVAAEVTLSGSNLGGNPRLLAPFAFDHAPVPGSDGSNFKVKVTVAPGTPIGVYPIRVRTDEGLSNPFLFSVGQLPQVSEKEDNSTFDQAQAIAVPAVVEGQTAGNDVDFFRFTGKKGQRIVLDAQCSRIGSGVDPVLRLTTIGHTYVASADDSPGLITDARLTAVLPEDTDYVIELSDTRYQGGARPVYRLVVGAVPMAEEIFPIGGRRGETVGFELRGGTIPDTKVFAATLSPAPGSEIALPRASNGMLGVGAPGEAGLEVESLFPLEVGQVPELREPAEPGAKFRAAVPVALNGRIDPAGDEDRFALAVTAGQKLRIEVAASEHGSALDGVLQVLGANDAVLATADDTTIPPQGGRRAGAVPTIMPDPSLDFTVPSGVSEITLALRDLQARGGVGFPYRISVTTVEPTFEVALNDAQVGLPKNGTAAVGVTVRRKGYTGPITLTVANPPAGLSVRPGTIADGQLLGSFSISAAPDAAFDVTYLDVIGQAQGPAGPIVSHAEKALVFAQQGPLPTNTVVQEGLAVALNPNPAITLEAPADAIEIAHGFGGPIPIKVSRTNGADTELAITPLPLPPGVTVPAAKIAAKAAEGTVTVNAAVETPLGAMSLALLAKGKVANADQTFAIPAVTIKVVRPVAVELAAPAIEVKAGTTFEVKGKVLRKAPFKDPVTIKVNGLPAGLKADPVTVAPDKAEFTVAIVADAKAAAATAGTNVAVAFQVNKKDYSTPAVPLSVKVLPAK